MKKVLLILMICFLITGCSFFNKKPTNNVIENNTTIEDNSTNETSDENATYVIYHGESINIDGNSNKSKEARIVSDINIFALENYKKDNFKKIISKSADKKVSLKELISIDSFDTSMLKEECENFCNLEESYIIVDYNNEENPIIVDLKLLNSNVNNNYEIIFGYAKKIYDDKIYLNATKEEDHYRITISELNTKYGYDISKITCNKKTTIIEFRPTEENENNSYPIFVYGC
jgi:hypothetical protein